MHDFVMRSPKSVMICENNEYGSYWMLCMLCVVVIQTVSGSFAPKAEGTGFPKSQGAGEVTVDR